MLYRFPQLRQTRRLVNANLSRVSIRVTKVFGAWTRSVDPVKIFLSSITLQNLLFINVLFAYFDATIKLEK